MVARQAPLLHACAVAHAAIGLLLLFASWDGLYSALDLPQPKPALFAQIAAPAAGIPAVLLSAAARRASLVPLVGAACGAADAVAALLLASWLAFRDLDLWGVDALGYALLGALLLVLTALAAVELALAARSRTVNASPTPTP